MLGIRWHSRAGHGAITSANALCEIIAEHTDLYSQSFPDFGAEKKGAPVVVYNRFDDKHIAETHHIRSPNLVLLLDTSLINPNELSYEHILDGLKDDGHLILNTKQDRTQFSDKFSGSVWHLDATTLSKEAIGRNIPNVPMLGALIKVSELIDIEEFATYLHTFLSQVFPEKIVTGNITALKAGYKNVRKV